MTHGRRPVTRIVVPERPAIERRILAACDAKPPRIPVLVGGCGSGRTSLLQRVAARTEHNRSQYIDAERAASTPEEFWAAVAAASPHVAPRATDPPRAGGSTRAAFDNLLAFFEHARAQDGGTPTFLIDGLLELRTFESFPGLRGALRETLAALTRSPNRFILATRYATRARRLLARASDRIEIVDVPPLSAAETAATLVRLGAARDRRDHVELGRLLHALADGRPAYVRALAAALAATDGDDPVQALAAQMAVGAPLCLVCHLSYQARLGRARGYGALKAILHLLADEERLTLTEIARRLSRTPGSTRDYLLWLEDVDLVQVEQKRYGFRDPLLRLWVRLHSRPGPPDRADLLREAQEYAVSRLPFMEDAAPSDPPAPTRPPAASERRWSLIEID